MEIIKLLLNIDIDFFLLSIFFYLTRILRLQILPTQLRVFSVQTNRSIQ